MLQNIKPMIFFTFVFVSLITTQSLIADTIECKFTKISGSSYAFPFVKLQFSEVGEDVIVLAPAGMQDDAGEPIEWTFTVDTPQELRFGAKALKKARLGNSLVGFQYTIFYRKNTKVATLRAFAVGRQFRSKGSCEHNENAANSE